METAEEALSDMPDVVLLRKIIKFFQEVSRDLNFRQLPVTRPIIIITDYFSPFQTYPEDEKSMKLLSIRCSKSYLSHHHVTFEYEAVDLINGYKMKQFLLEKMNKKLRAEVKKRKKIGSKYEKGERQNIQTPLIQMVFHLHNSIQMGRIELERD